MNYQFLYSCSLSPLTIRLTVVFFLPLFAYTPAKGQPQVIGSPQPIMATPGDSVVLPCHVEPPIDVRGVMVEWSRLDRKSDPRDWLSGRTEQFTDRLRQGNISLKIINVTLADEGRYRCFIRKLKSTKRSIVHLVIEPNYDKNRTTEMPLHPRNLQTPDPKEETDIRDGWSSRSRLTLVGLICVLLILSVGVGGYRLIQEHLKQTVHQSL